MSTGLPHLFKPGPFVGTSGRKFGGEKKTTFWAVRTPPLHTHTHTHQAKENTEITAGGDSPRLEKLLNRSHLAAGLLVLRKETAPTNMKGKKQSTRANPMNAPRQSRESTKPPSNDFRSSRGGAFAAAERRNSIALRWCCGGGKTAVDRCAGQSAVSVHRSGGGDTGAEGLWAEGCTPTPPPGDPGEKKEE